jgi:hypothetical protein
VRETLLKGRGLLEAVRSRCMMLLCCWWEVYAKARSGSTWVGLLADMPVHGVRRRECALIRDLATGPGFDGPT